MAMHGDAVPLFFYSDLFLRHPETRDLFPVSMAAQRDRLVRALGRIVSDVEHADALGEYLRGLGREHRKFGAIAEYYPYVGASLVATLAHFNGPAWTPELAADWKAAYGTAWVDVSNAEAARRKLYDVQRFTQIRGSELAGLGLRIVQYVQETHKPDAERLPGFHEAQLPSLRVSLLSPAPIYVPLEEALLADALQESLEKLGPDHPFIKATLEGGTPQDAAKALLGNTKLTDPAVRKRLLDGGPAAIEQSTDPLIVLGRKLAPMAKTMHDTMEREVTGIETAAHEKLGQARFAVYGTSVYPDATFTLRLSYGSVRGYPMNGTLAPYKTTFAGLYDRSASFDNKPPFNLTPRFAVARNKIDGAIPLDFVTTNDIIGGNSGSPVVNRNAELVGLIFDGNIESLAGRYVYDETKNRAVAVHSAAILEALRVVYDAGPLADELAPPSR